MPYFTRRTALEEPFRQAPARDLLNGLQGVGR
jgi:hypothetical protein